MSETLTPDELTNLIRSVFEPGDADRGLAILVDLPDERLPDNDDWKARRAIASQWATMLSRSLGALGLEEVVLCPYPNVGSNNGDLPERIGVMAPDQLMPINAAELDTSCLVSQQELFDRFSILIALTELSATAPLKIEGRKGKIRAATMPGFVPSMIPSLRLDYGEINRRVDHLKRLLDEAEGAWIRLATPGDKVHSLHLDLRHREAHPSGGLQRKPGQVGNLPSGETYIVPYEGEIEDDPSRSEGELPVQFEHDVVLYRIEQNKAVEVLSLGGTSQRESELIEQEPAYANLAELGFGVLADFGVKPCGEILLDEKLGLHIAFGRSDHFGGQVGPNDFTSPDTVVHIDRVYLPETQPDVTLVRLDLEMPGERVIELMADGTYSIELGEG